MTADFASTDTTRYNNLVGASAGNFVLTKERATNGGFNTYIGTSKIPKAWTSTNFAITDGRGAVNKKRKA